ncbi:hypothetical protein GCM10017044_16890 [Kordiimonas sediminis]|uniref:Cell division protein FtsL n=1 Tax=Kordiimonas sediminis TaxID=1735581 RepID=A0A919ATW4_9PROT|nr:hypothetical protein [Kordiimonas sediminis]GHF23097.1 hypothetical protein GCM10017044_16890 [Kordiimonas sediminis]
MRKGLVILASFIAVAAGVAVLLLKLAVHEKEQELKALHVQIKRDQEAIRVLEAEWAYKTSPSKLQDKSLRFLALMPPKPDQIILTPAVVPLRPTGEEVDSNVDVLLPERIRKKIEEATKGKSRHKSSREGKAL